SRYPLPTPVAASASRPGATGFVNPRHPGRVMKGGANPQPLDPLHAEQLVDDTEPRLGRQVVDPVEAGEEAVLLPGSVAEPAQGVEDRVGVDDQARLAVLVVGAEDRSLTDRIELLGDQLEAGRVG